MAERIRLPFDELVLEGSLASTELVLGTQALNELVIEGSLASEELVILSGAVPAVIDVTYLISRNTGDTLMSRNTGDLLIPRSP